MAGYTLYRRALVGTTILASHVGVVRHNFAAMVAIRGFCDHISFAILQSCPIGKPGLDTLHAGTNLAKTMINRF
jgi:hypothetical protein